MQRYNTSFNYQLIDGTDVIFREIIPEDKERIQKGLKLLSDNSIYTRFFSPVTKFSDKLLEYLTKVDQKNHVAWGVMCPQHPELPGLGICRFIRSEKYQNRAEFAITIIDDFQSKGLGTEFLALLYILASFHKIEMLCGTALNANKAMINRFKLIGAKVSWNAGECELHIPIYKDYEKFEKNKYSDLFKKLLVTFSERLTVKT